MPIFAVQKAAAPKNGVEFRQGSNDTIRSRLATSCDVSEARGQEIFSHRQTDRQRIDILEGHALQAAPSKIIRDTYLTS